MVACRLAQKCVCCLCTHLPPNCQYADRQLISNVSHRCCAERPSLQACPLIPRRAYAARGWLHECGIPRLSTSTHCRARADSHEPHHDNRLSVWMKRLKTGESQCSRGPFIQHVQAGRFQQLVYSTRLIRKRIR
ncbi:hypothetical protein T440DRAFT_150627 [Plenodomus tracheiphilus IPT5]|uniref:Uncharacterized protein n=1 Tax=Plenodomus tracheiphilus IPT5 TaxID=1408161 RepID=A0A6A7AZD0_9PLEO|nr:hypothetical protein T440DRAFT_150627 [Plenodomus tracheiphilus IPT5]